MRAIPEEILKLYPLDPFGPHDLSDRPWWRACSWYPSGAPALWERLPLSVGDIRWRESSPKACAVRDKSDPLPHPGFRVGQVWASVNADGYVSATIIDAQSSGPDGDPAFGLAEDIGAGLSRGGNRRYYPIETLKDRLQGAFLMADPCCQWLAPWAPVG